jgi:hypothetical protein
MSEVMTARDRILDSLVAAVVDYEKLCNDQCDRLDGFRVESTRLSEGLSSEFKVMDDEIKLIADFIDTTDRFPKADLDETVTVTEKQIVRKSWFSWPRSEEVLKEIASPVSNEVKVQDARLLHLVDLMVTHIAARRARLAETEFNLKKFAVNLNDAERISVDEGDRKQISRDRYLVEQLVSNIEARRQELIIIGRKVVMLHERMQTPKPTGPVQNEAA